MAGATEVRELLVATPVPDEVVDGVLGEASALWLMAERADVLAADVALCHPPLAADEIRASVRPTSLPFSWRLTVVAPDQPGLLAALAGSLAEQWLSISRAAATLWSAGGIAIISVVVTDPAGTHRDGRTWDRVAARLKAVVAGDATIAFEVERRGPVVVRATRQGDRSIVAVRTPDRMGLLWAIADWFAGQGANIEAMHIRTTGDDDESFADDTFLVAGDLDVDDLVVRLSGQAPDGGIAPAVIGVALLPVRIAVGVANRLLPRRR
jgi:UTP:GlnB (protein PII) uridylyltransferase